MVTLWILLVVGTLSLDQSKTVTAFDPAHDADDVFELRAPSDRPITCALGVDAVRGPDGAEVSPIVIDDRVLAFVFVPAPNATYSANALPPGGLAGDAGGEVSWLRATPVGVDRSVRVEPAPRTAGVTRSIYTPRLPTRVRLFRPMSDAPARMRVTGRSGLVRVLHLRAHDDLHWRISHVDAVTPDTPFVSRPSADARDALLVVDTEAGSSYRVDIVSATGGAPVGWTVLGNDDGETDSHWGQVGASSQRAVKTFDLDSPVPARARVVYRMAAAPYHPLRKAHDGSEACENAEWGWLDIYVNGERAARRPLPDGAATGWHVVPVEAAHFSAGRNEVALSVTGSGAFYLAIDHDTTAGRSHTISRGRRSESLRPGKAADPGEYLLRLWVAP